MSIDKTILLNKYYDIYETLLTERQKEIFRYYYHDDLSYQEIADILAISRAGVYDVLKRTVDFLEDTERKLGFERKMSWLIAQLTELGNEDVERILSEFERGGLYE